MILTLSRFIINLVCTCAAALAGNWLGGQIRSYVTGNPVQTIKFTFITEKDQRMSNFPVTTKFYPAMLLSLIGKPRWLFAFLGGLLTGVLVDDRYERLLLERFVEPIVTEGVSRVEQG